MEHFPIVPYKIISYKPVQMESNNVVLLVETVLNFVDRKKYSIEVICSHAKLKSIMKEKLMYTWRHCELNWTLFVFNRHLLQQSSVRDRQLCWQYIFDGKRRNNYVDQQGVWP